MFRYNLLIALRNFRRHKGSFLINLIGLSTGLACALLIYLWVSDENSVDKFHKNDSHLFQVMERSTENGQEIVHEGTQGPLAEAMAKDLPEVQQAVPVVSMAKVGIRIPLQVGDKVLKGGAVFAGRHFFQLFSFDLIQGNAKQVLDRKEAIVLSESFAKKLFGSADEAMGKIIEWEVLGKKYKSEVTGVFNDPPANNSMVMDFAFAYDLLYYDIAPNFQKWWNEGAATYLLLKPGTNIDQFNSKIKDFVKKYLSQSIFTLFVRPYSSGYLYGKYENGVQSGGRIEYVRLLSIVAIFILVIACINFMNLSTARASRRLKEVGIKKAVGSSRSALIVQFLTEAIFMAMVSLMVAWVIAFLFLPLFNQLTGKQLWVEPDPKLIILSILIALVTGLVAGSYPAFYMSAFDVVSVFKGKTKRSFGELMARKGLVVFQFMVSLILMVAVMVIYRQINYVQSKNLGFDRQNVVQFEKDGGIMENPNAFLLEARKIPGVASASQMQESIMSSQESSSTYGIEWPGKKESDLVDFVVRAVDFGVIETLGLKIQEGRSFSNQFGGDDASLLFNETAIRIMGLKNPVGTKVKMWGSDKTIVGVVRDFHLSSLHDKIGPMVFTYNPERTSSIIVRIKEGREKETLAELSGLFRSFNPGFDFEYRFLDDQYQQLYVSEHRISVLSRYFAGLAIIISCLGLFGLAAFNAEVRTKEIGIRKVLGASVANVMVMLSRDFIRLVVLSMIIAFPLAWWAMNAWLNSFAYRTTIGVDVFLFAGLVMMLLALMTVCFQSIRTALMNPVKSLRNE